MEIAFTLILLTLVLLFYLSNPHNKINKWCSIAGIFFWLGAAKEAVLYNIIPLMRDAESLRTLFMPVYSACTWALYSLAMPTAIIFALYFCDMDKNQPRLLRTLKAAIYIPALIFSFFFPPLDFRAYQLGSAPFWITYAIYNLIAAAVYAVLIIRGVNSEMPGKSRDQKRRVRLVVLPPVLFWAASVFLTHPFKIQSLFKLWEINAVFLLVGVLIFIFMAFRDGVMGLRLSGETYNWSSDMRIVSKSAAYTSHMLKNQTVKMEWCIENLKAYCAPEPPEELAILSRSISAIKSYIEEMKKHSENIVLLEKTHNLKGLLEKALSLSLESARDTIDARISVPDGVFWLCDENHMTEAFANIISNAIDAIDAARRAGVIEISGGFSGRGRDYLLSISDNGAGMSRDELRNMFAPYYTTKNTERSFGLGLAYCKNVVEKHGGSITAASEKNKGTTITIRLPGRRVTTP